MTHGKFVVQLDRSVYLAGQVVTGRVCLYLDAAETVTCLTAECVGKCDVTWSDSDTSGRETETIHYQASESYFAQTVSLFGSTEARTLGRGEYVYDFAFTLPAQLPTSYEGAHGYVRYYVRARLGRPHSFNYDFKGAFSVHDLVDLNLIGQAAEPLERTDSKTVCCWCCQSGPITARCWLAQTGYAPGQAVLFNGHVDNKSRSPLVATRLELVEKSRFTAQGKHKEHTRTVLEKERRQSADVDCAVWDRVPLLVPPLAPSRLNHCSLIDVSYELLFIVDPGTFSFNLTLPMEILIGSVPLRSGFDQLAAPTAPMPPFRIELYPDLPIFQSRPGHFAGDLKEAGDSMYLNVGFDTKFAPQYLCYGQPQS